MKTAPLLHRNVSEYTFQCDQGYITVVVCVIRIGLYNRDNNQHGKDQSLNANGPCSRFHRGSLIQCTAKKFIGASYVNFKHETFET